MVHTEPRYTKDIHIWIEPTENNASALLTALSEFGAPIQGLSPGTFTEEEIFFQIGIEPVRADIMTSVTGLRFPDAFERRVVVDFGGESAPVLSKADLFDAKISAGRTRDLRDARSLSSAKKWASKKKR